MGYKIARFLINLIVLLTMRVRRINPENLPQDNAGLIIVANHLGRLDVPLVYHFLKRDDIILLVAEKYQAWALARWFVKQLDAIYIDRFNADFGALRKALIRLRKGGVMVLSPEGTRSKSGVLLEGRPGASYLAAKAGVPILPVAVTGTEDRLAKKNLTRLRRLQVTIRVGKPFSLPPIKGKEHDVLLQAYTDEIMCQIAALLPAEYRGFYADHPRLKELLQGQTPPPMQSISIKH
jgi:1-acyl-sn-glycerol-3-phosphate acyltransferase